MKSIICMEIVYLLCWYVEVSSLTLIGWNDSNVKVVLSLVLSQWNNTWKMVHFTFSAPNVLFLHHQVNWFCPSDPRPCPHLWVNSENYLFTCLPLQTLVHLRGFGPSSRPRDISAAWEETPRVPAAAVNWITVWIMLGKRACWSSISELCMSSSCRGRVLPGLRLQTHLRHQGVVILLQVWTQWVIKLVWEISANAGSDDSESSSTQQRLNRKSWYSLNMYQRHKLVQKTPGLYQ